MAAPRAAYFYAVAVVDLPMRPADLHIQPLRQEHAHQAARVLNAAYDDWRALPKVDVYVDQDPPPLQPADVASTLADKTDAAALSFLASLDETPAACAIAWRDGDRAVVGHLGVAPPLRRRGIATALLEAIRQAAARLGLSTIRLRRLDSRYQPAIAFAESRGFSWADPDSCQVTMQIDITKWQPKPINLPAGYSIRTWQGPEDAHAWSQVKDAAFGTHTQPQFWFDRFWSRHDFDPEGWFLCLHADQPVGIAAAVMVRDKASGRVQGGCIEWVGVHPDHRGRGLGRALMHCCLNYAARFNPNPMVLVTEMHRRPAVALYESLGFRVVRQWRSYDRKL